MRAIISRAVCLALLVVQSVALSQPGETYEIRVLLVHGKSGKPLAGKGVQICGYDRAPSEKGEPRFELQAKTGPDGSAVFRLKEPLPRELLVGPWEAEVTSGCSLALFPTEKVLHSGIVHEDKCLPRGKLKGKFSPEPGKIVLFGIPHSRWEIFDLTR